MVTVAWASGKHPAYSPGHSKKPKITRKGGAIYEGRPIH